MTRVAVLGATGYGGGELLRLLLAHPAVEVVCATSRSQTNIGVGKVHKNLLGMTDLEFTSPTVDQVADMADVVIGALPHGASAEVLAPFVERGTRVVDLSGDYRLRDLAAYRKWYKRDHPQPHLIEKAVYGCPELNRDEIERASLVASPGCFATAMNLAFLPGAAAGLLAGRATVVAMTGSSGSGADAGAGTHHPTRSQTLRPYKVLGHQHVPEVQQLIADAGSIVDGIDFTPVSAPLVRGIIAVVTITPSRPMSDDEAYVMFREYYSEHPFVKVLSSREPECAPIAGTNYAEVRARTTPDGRLHVICAIDNLVKGGAGQAVQSLNIMLGLEERTGLEWAGTWP